MFAARRASSGNAAHAPSQGNKLAERGCVRALRCQLPRRNDFYPYEPPGTRPSSHRSTCTPHPTTARPPRTCRWARRRGRRRRAAGSRDADRQVRSGSAPLPSIELDWPRAPDAALCGPAPSARRAPAQPWVPRAGAAPPFPELALVVEPEPEKEGRSRRLRATSTDDAVELPTEAELAAQVAEITVSAGQARSEAASRPTARSTPMLIRAFRSLPRRKMRRRRTSRRRTTMGTTCTAATPWATGFARGWRARQTSASGTATTRVRNLCGSVPAASPTLPPCRRAGAAARHGARTRRRVPSSLTDPFIDPPVAAADPTWQLLRVPGHAAASEPPRP